LKYHHYVNDESDLLNSTPTSTPASSTIIKTKPTEGEEEGNKNKQISLSKKAPTLTETSTESDPYEVIHCKCANHTSVGFMIQCEICLCWQHGECMNVHSADQVPKYYLCWICNLPGNQLKRLKYQNWIQRELDKEKEKENESPDEMSEEAKTVEISKLKFLNDCSKKYYNLKLLMYTLEYQMSMLNQIEKESSSVKSDSSNDEYIQLEIEMENLLKNISHLQDCLNKKFEEFNNKINGNFK
jgi:hypothetical protein